MDLDAAVTGNCEIKFFKVVVNDWFPVKLSIFLKGSVSISLLMSIKVLQLLHVVLHSYRRHKLGKRSGTMALQELVEM